METFTVKSTESNARLIFSRRVGEDFLVEFQSEQLTVAQPVCGYTDPYGVLRLFQEAAAHLKPWQGQISYRSLEQEFALSASCSSLGHVLLNATFLRVGCKEEWSATASVQTEMGQLSQIASNAKRFFGENGR